MRVANNIISISRKQFSSIAQTFMSVGKNVHDEHHREEEINSNENTDNLLAQDENEEQKQETKSKKDNRNQYNLWSNEET